MGDKKYSYTLTDSSASMNAAKTFYYVCAGFYYLALTIGVFVAMR